MLKIAMVMADFSGDEAEELRRALSFHRSEERMNKVGVKLRTAMERKGVAPDKIDKIIQSISSFALYGFPESHAISFAILAYGSAYLKVHRAPEFYASLLNNQPMGFYTPATIVKDAQRHGVKIMPVCVTQSDWRCTVVDDNTSATWILCREWIATGTCRRTRQATAGSSIRITGRFQAARLAFQRRTAHIGGIRRIELFCRTSPRGDVACGRDAARRSSGERGRLARCVTRLA